MNEQHIDALPQVQPPQANNQTATTGSPQALPTGGKPLSGPTSPAGGNLVDPAAVHGPSMPQAAANAPVQNPVTGSTPPIADDIDLIEKEWVAKAKQIVQQTKDDPFKQNQAMTNVKADYIKKRYNRELKTGKE